MKTVSNNSNPQALGSAICSSRERSSALSEEVRPLTSLSMSRSPTPRRRATLASLAAELKVSRTTISNAYNRPDQLSADLRERVLATAKRLGYAGPDPVARSLRTRKAELPLYITRIKVYPRAIKGLWRRVKWAALALLLGLYIPPYLEGWYLQAARLVAGG